MTKLIGMFMYIYVYMIYIYIYTIFKAFQILCTNKQKKYQYSTEYGARKIGIKDGVSTFDHSNFEYQYTRKC